MQYHYTLKFGPNSDFSNYVDEMDLTQSKVFLEEYQIGLERLLEELELFESPYCTLDYTLLSKEVDETLTSTMKLIFMFQEGVYSEDIVHKRVHDLLEGLSHIHKMTPHLQFDSRLRKARFKVYSLSKN